jgi:hypothetical protein
VSTGKRRIDRFVRKRRDRGQYLALVLACLGLIVVFYATTYQRIVSPPPERSWAEEGAAFTDFVTRNVEEPDASAFRTEIARFFASAREGEDSYERVSGVVEAMREARMKETATRGDIDRVMERLRAARSAGKER